MVDFQVSPEDLSELIGHGFDDTSGGVERISALGGVNELMKKMGTDPDTGLPSDEQTGDYAQRKQYYGTNVFKTKPPKSLFSFWLDAMGDHTLILLACAAVVSIILEMTFGHEKAVGWIEGAAILVAVLLVSGVTATNDWSKDRKFRQLSAVTSNRTIKVMRGGEQTQIFMSDILVGDIVHLETGDFIPADCLFVSGHSMSSDESPMTGEPVAVTKDQSNPFFYSGCTVVEGVGKVVVVATGMNSQWGKLKAALDVEEENTPLQDRLDWLAGFIGKVGTIAAGLTFVSLILQWSIPEYAIRESPWFWVELDNLVRFLIISITIIVVAVPEGLPLAVTISLAYSMFKMMADQNLVRHLVACETMGGATQICSDKTGTLTQNKMTVVKAWICGQQFDYEHDPVSPDAFNPRVFHLLTEGVCINSSARYNRGGSGPDGFVGNKTECALLIYADKLGKHYDEVHNAVRILNVLPFNSKKKRMSTLIANDNGGARLYVKGASEVILERSIKYLSQDGDERDLEDDMRNKLNDVIVSLASDGYRTLSLSYKDFDSEPKVSRRGSTQLGKRTSVQLDNKDETNLTKRKSRRSSYILTSQDELGKRRSSVKVEKQVVALPPEEEDMDTDLTLIGIVGIEDPIRKEVPGAVEACKAAGITVRMLTGDNILTAKTIAKRCGILDEESGGIAIEGPKFREILDNKSKLDRMLPKIQVMARCSPDDKLQLVKRLREKGEVVAVTGDGTNDAPQLMEADVGFAMGIAGTDVAKDASDIILLDDNFNSIVKAVMWGRNVFDSIRKFVQFQLTINVAAVLIAFIGALTKGESPLKAIQLLWVNLIMDTMAALALATEPPTSDLLQRPPYGRHTNLITKRMWRFILGHATYQLAVLFTLLYAGRNWEFLQIKTDTQHQTLIFNAFVFCQVFNEFNARKLGDELNMFKNIGLNFIFISVIVITVVVQALIVQFGGLATQTVPLNWQQWLFSILLGFIELPYGMLLRFIPVREDVHGVSTSAVNEKSGLISRKREREPLLSSGNMHDV
eukprot:TRINITY_DN7486_c0_g7_i1.p1 TRINITY_DN7486_c0_g7~~TRINITY_DN7486_c0_g7_i1.p1  ORF type:complete len:1045 (-),score=272.60 TRINITY_DN7486_c0_g7_i1:55-3144(-)